MRVTSTQARSRQFDSWFTSRLDSSEHTSSWLFFWPQLISVFSTEWVCNGSFFSCWYKTASFLMLLQASPPLSVPLSAASPTMPKRQRLSRKCKSLKEHGVRKGRSGKKGQPRATLTNEEAAHIFQMRLKCCQDVADCFGVAPKTVRDIWNRRTWTHVTDSVCGSTQAAAASLGHQPVQARDPAPAAVHCWGDVQQPLFGLPESDCHSVAASSFLGDDDDDDNNTTATQPSPGMDRVSALDYDHELAFY